MASRIFESAMHESRFVLGSLHKTVMCHILTRWNVRWIAIRDNHKQRHSQTCENSLANIQDILKHYKNYSIVMTTNWWLHRHSINDQISTSFNDNCKSTYKNIYSRGQSKFTVFLSTYSLMRLQQSNFIWLAPHTHTHTHIQSADKHILCT